MTRSKFQFSFNNQKIAVPLVLWIDHVGMGDVDKVGGKNASLGEMIQSLGSKGVIVPGGLATTAFAYREFLKGGLSETLDSILKGLDNTDVKTCRRESTRCGSRSSIL